MQIAEKKTNATERVVSSLLRLIGSGRFGIGDRLPSEAEIAETCQVGRSAVREGIRQVVALGLISVKAGKGTYVESVRPDVLLLSEGFEANEFDRTSQELLEVRLIVEPHAAALAAERASEEEIERMAHDVRMLEQAVAVGFRPPEDLGFHLDIIRAARNRALLRVGAAIISFYARDEAIPSQHDIDAHRLIYEAIRNRDPRAALEAMKAHLEHEIERRTK